MDALEIGRRIEAIRQDEERGATQLAGEAVRLLAEIAADESIPNHRFAPTFEQAIHDLARVRPSMASLLNGVGVVAKAWLEAGAADRLAEARRAVEAAARRWDAMQGLAISTIADHAAETLSGSVITLSYSSTVIRALNECWKRGVLTGVIVAEARPLFEGRRTASLLAEQGIPTALITDAEIGIFVSTAGAAVAGADSILRNGALVNKAGTLLLALAARRCRVPFFTLAETHKISPGPRPSVPFSLEEKAAEEVVPEPIPGVAARNVYFDLTPARYLTGYITERGVLDRRDVTALAREAPGRVALGMVEQKDQTTRQVK